MLGTVWKVTKEVVIGIFLVLGLWLIGHRALIEIKGGAQFGTLMDTVIAVSNVIMAGAAIFAAIKSKNWFKDKTIENAAIKFESLLLELNPLMAHFNAFYDHLNHPKSGENMIHQYDKDKQSIITNYHKYKASHNLLKLWGDSIFRKTLLDSASNIEKNSFAIYKILNESREDAYLPLQRNKNDIQKTIEKIRSDYNELTKFNINTLLPSK